MVSVSYEVDGHKVSWDQFQDAIVAEMMQHVGDELKAKLAACSCPTHHEQPKVTVKSQDGSSMTYEITGCCDALREQAEKTLEGLD